MMIRDTTSTLPNLPAAPGTRLLRAAEAEGRAEPERREIRRRRPRERPSAIRIQSLSQNFPLCRRLPE